MNLHTAIYNQAETEADIIIANYQNPLKNFARDFEQKAAARNLTREIRAEIKAAQPAGQPRYTITLPEKYATQLHNIVDEFITYDATHHEYGTTKENFTEVHLPSIHRAIIEWAKGR